MPLPTLQDKAPAWALHTGKDRGVALWSECTLVRNLAEFPFPDVCSKEDKLFLRERIVSVLDKLNILSVGHYFHLEDLSKTELRFLSERQLITRELLQAEGARGIYFSEDQSLSIMINGSDHLCLRTMHSGLHLQDAWAQLNLLDDELSNELDFAFMETHGYLTPSLEMIGTGLKANVLVHLPALTLTGGVHAHIAQAEERRLLILGVLPGKKQPPKADGGETDETREKDFSHHSIFSTTGNLLGGASDKTFGELYQVVNQSTLGLSEVEILFQVKQLSDELIADELETRKEMESDSVPVIRDRVGRALGIAQNAHLMEFFEVMEILSALRWGVQAGYLPHTTQQEINLALLATQGAHLEMSAGVAGDDTELNVRRAAYMRSRFASQ